MPKVDPYERNTGSAPHAHSVELGVCGAPDCKAVHIMLLDADDVLLASASLSPETVAAIATMSMTLAAKARA